MLGQNLMESESVVTIIEKSKKKFDFTIKMKPNYDKHFVLYFSNLG
jgi:hypothetical protein